MSRMTRRTIVSRLSSFHFIQLTRYSLVSTRESRSPTPEAGPFFPARQRNKRLVSALSFEDVSSSALSSKKTKTSKGKLLMIYAGYGGHYPPLGQSTRHWPRSSLMRMKRDLQLISQLTRFI